MAGAFDDDGLGALINNSRGITHAYERPAYRARFGENWQAAIEQAVRDMIDDLAANTNAGRLRTSTVAAHLTWLIRDAHISGNDPSRTARRTIRAPVPSRENGTAIMNITLQL